MQAQYTLLKEIFNIEKIKLVIGWSMGGQQAFQWASYFPDMVENMISMCGHAKTTEHTYVFLEGVYAALTSDLKSKQHIHPLKIHMYALWF